MRLLNLVFERLWHQLRMSLPAFVLGVARLTAAFDVAFKILLVGFGAVIVGGASTVASSILLLTKSFLSF